MYDRGYKNIYNIDISPIVIEQMAKRNAINRPELKCKFTILETKPIGEVMDVMDMKFESDFFDLIIDKSTIDALLCGDHAFLYVALMMKVMIDTIIKQQLTIYQAINYYMISDFCV